MSQYFATFSSVLIVHNTTLDVTPLRMEYLDALQLALCKLSQPIKLQWINIAEISNDSAQPDALEWRILRALNDSVTEVGAMNPEVNSHLSNHLFFYLPGIYYCIAADKAFSSRSLLCHT